jgi:hypothetical protein
MRFRRSCAYKVHDPPICESLIWIISPFKFWTATIFLHAHLQVVYYKCIKFHKNPISGLGGVALTRYMDGRTDRRTDVTDGRTDGRTGWFLYTPQTLFAGGIMIGCKTTWVVYQDGQSSIWGGGATGSDRVRMRNQNWRESRDRKYFLRIPGFFPVLFLCFLHYFLEGGSIERVCPCATGSCAISALVGPFHRK